MADPIIDTPDASGVAAEYLGIRVPHSPFLNEARIARIAAGRYEGPEIAAALALVGPDDRVIELGAGIGLVGAVVAHQARPAAMMSFEANPALVPVIEDLYALNGLEGAITLKNQVLLAGPDRPEVIPFHVRNSFLGSSLIENKARKSRAVAVPTADFETVRKSFRPTVLIMDIEGGERDLLESADLSGIRAVIVEFHPGAYGVPGMRRCKSILRAAGFRKSEDHSTRTVWACERDADAATESTAPPRAQ